MSTTHRWLGRAAVTAALGVLGCSSSTGTIPRNTVITYTAILWTITDTGVETNALQAGATLDLELTEDGRVSGTLFMPAAINNGADLTADMTGTYTITQGILRFAQTADTFVREVGWDVDGQQLIASEVVDGADVFLILSTVF